MSIYWYGASAAKNLRLPDEELAYSFLEWYRRAHQEGYSAEHIEESELERLYPAFRSWSQYKWRQSRDNHDATVERMSEYILRLEKTIRDHGIQWVVSPHGNKRQWYWRVFVGIVRRDHVGARRVDFARDYCALPREVRWKFRKLQHWYEWQVAWWMGSGELPEAYKNDSLWEKARIMVLRVMKRTAYAIRIGFVKREMKKGRDMYYAALRKWKSGKGPKP